jgi:thiamine phosphate synthase YjbQ (UPF0047 family)
MQGDWFTTTPRRRGRREGVSQRNNATGQSGIAAASTTFVHRFVTVDSTEHRQVIDITDNVREAIQSACTTPSAQSGIVTISSMHTTCAIMVNENEHFLCEDVSQHLNTLVPPTGEYGHNNMDKRPATERDADAIRKNEYGGLGSIEAFMKNEPVNAHAHIQSILVGNSTSLGVEEGELMIGSWQSVLMLELDGPRQNRKVSISCLLSSSS